MSSVRLFVSSILVIGFTFAAPAQAAFTPAYLKESGTLPVLMYHRIRTPSDPQSIWGPSDVEEAIFERQLAYFDRNGFRSLSVSEAADLFTSCPYPIPDKLVVLTFDDGYEDFYTVVFPLLKKYNVKANLFMIVQAIDDPPEYQSAYRHLSSSQLREISNSGLVEVNSHTMSHVNRTTNLPSGLSSRSDDQIRFELGESKRILEQLIAKPILRLAYPFGNSNERVQRIASEFYSQSYVIRNKNIDCGQAENNSQALTRQTAPNESFYDCQGILRLTAIIQGLPRTFTAPTGC